jgi:hypothetical protein
MRLVNSSAYVCGCGHTVKPEIEEFRCSCAHCRRAQQQVALLADLPPSPTPIEITRQTEILHCLNLVTLGKVMPNMEKDESTETTPEPEADMREIEIQKELLILYEQQKAFAHPTPSEAPHEYEPEELETWGELKSRIHALEAELAEMKPRTRSSAH